jgi:N-acetyl-gamma-glutamyl-phosphate reductase
MTRVGVIGATGYAGAELVRILCGHPGIELTIVTSRQYAGVNFDQVYPSMTGVIDLVCQELSVDSICDRTDVVFTALPHKLPMKIVPELIERGKKVIDLSADFRFKDVATYESFYQPHTAGDLLEKSVYGLCEIYFDTIKNAVLIGAPGCYPTSVLLLLVPLLKSNLIDINNIVADSKSGVSGAGRTLSLTTHFCEVNESFKAYKVAEHRHNPEMEEVCLTSFYTDRMFIRICPDNRIPDTLHVRGSNYCDIGFKLDARNNCLILISAIDNLVKGAAGQAVQNMNIMLGLDETAGLKMVPFPI